MDYSTRQHLLHHLYTLAQIPDSEAERFLNDFEVTNYPRGSFFTRDGDTHDRVGFVILGVFRVYYTSSDGEMHIRNFCKEGMPLGSYATILQKQPAHVAIEALEDSIVAQFSYQALKSRFDRHAAWERLGRRIAEEHYISRERREYQLLAFDATARYEKFLEDFPGLEARITQANIASYVGVKPETLSRISKKRCRP